MTDTSRPTVSQGRSPGRDHLFSRAHMGLPDDAPWVFRVPLRSRAFLLITVVTTIVLGIVIANRPEWLLWFDEPISTWVRGFIADGDVALAVTVLGSPNVSLVIGVVGVAILWRWCRASAITLGVLISSAFIVDIGLKLIVDRPRPPDPLIGTALASFPSGHVIHVVVVFGLVPMFLWALTHRRSYLRAGFVVFTVVVLGVAISRVALGAHWPSDVIVSMLIGISLLLGAEKLLTSPWAGDRCSVLGLHNTVGH